MYLVIELINNKSAETRDVLIQGRPLEPELVVISIVVRLFIGLNLRIINPVPPIQNVYYRDSFTIIVFVSDSSKR